MSEENSEYINKVQMFSPPKPIWTTPNRDKFTLIEWETNKEDHIRNAIDQLKLTDLVVGECDKVIENVAETSIIHRQSSEHRIQQRKIDIDYIKDELQLQRKNINQELNALEMYKSRLQDCIAYIEEIPLNICRKCLALRDGRIGIDLIADPVELALQKEIRTINDGVKLLKKSLDQVFEEMRRLRATRYVIDKDLYYKESSVDTEDHALTTNSSDVTVHFHEPHQIIDNANVTLEQYLVLSANNIKNAIKQIATGAPTRALVDSVLKQVIDDLKNASDLCEFEFHQHVKRTRSAKEEYENRYMEIALKVQELQKRITNLEKSLQTAESNAALIYTRLDIRAQRLETELVKDEARRALLLEYENCIQSIKDLRQMLSEGNATLRYLLQTQKKLEENINIKLNTLKIDEVDCMTLRNGMDYHYY